MLLHVRDWLKNLFHPRRAGRRPARRSPVLESLGARNLPAVTGTTFAAGVLSVSCDGADDQVTMVRNARGDILLQQGNGAATFIPGNPTVANTSRIRLIGGEGNDTLAISIPGWLGDHTLYGQGGDDILIGGEGKSVFEGGAGNDRMTGGLGNDIFNGGDGVDGVSEEADVDFRLTNTTLTGLGSDTLRENIEFAWLFGGPSANLIDASAFTGTVWLDGRGGNDILVGSNTNRTYDLLQGGEGRDLLIGRGGADVIQGGVGEDILVDGRTPHDTNHSALRALMAEWGRTDLAYADRIRHLTGEVSGGLNGAVVINWRNIVNDGVEDYMYGDEDLDWFLALDWSTDPKDRGPGERSN